MCQIASASAFEDAKVTLRVQEKDSCSNSDYIAEKMAGIESSLSGIVSTDVLVLGAGISGISAALELQKANVNFIVLEGREEIGGRISHQTLQDGTVIEMGANWVHGTIGFKGEENNPIWNLVKDCDLQGIKTDWDSVITYDEEFGSNPVPDELVPWDRFEEAYELAEEVSDKQFLSSLKKEQSMSVTYEVLLRRCGWQAKTKLEHAVEWFMIDYDLGDHSGAVSSLGANGYNYPNWKEEDFFITDQRGYVQVVHKLAQSIDKSKIVLNSRVTKIETPRKKNYVEVTTLSGPNKSELVFHAKKVITTFSTGVLQRAIEGGEGSLRFVPSLPKWKQDAISEMKMAHYTKFFLQFDSIFWDDESFIMFAGWDRGEFPVWQNMEKFPGFENKKVLMVTMIGEPSRTSAHRPLPDMVRLAMTSLRKIYPQAPEPVDAILTRWSADEWSFGSFSVLAPGSMPWVPALLGEPVGNLHFCGEGTHVVHLGTVHGAMESGSRAGRKVIKELKSNKASKSFDFKKFLKSFQNKYT